jgi:hypothetical protein
MEKTPRAVEDALLADGETVGEIRLRELTLATMLLLRKIESPLFCQKPYDQEEWARTLYCMTRPAAEIRAALAAGTLAEAALVWADEFGPETYDQLVAAAGRVLDRAFAFSVPASVPAEGGGAEAPPAGEAPGAPAMASSPCSGAGPRSTSESPTKPCSTGSPSPG